MSTLRLPTGSTFAQRSAARADARAAAKAARRPQHPRQSNELPGLASGICMPIGGWWTY
jgi:hypothetical protein